MGYNASFLTEADTWALRSLRPLSSPQCHVQLTRKVPTYCKLPGRKTVRRDKDDVIKDLEEAWPTTVALITLAEAAEIEPEAGGEMQSV